MEITNKMVDGYATAVAREISKAGITAGTAVDREELTAQVLLPDAWTDEDGRSGIMLRWGPDGSEEPGWTASVLDPATARTTLHTDLRLGIVPAPEVVAQAATAIVKDGSLRAGQIVPGTAEMLARYSGDRDEWCGCPPDATDVLDGVTIPWHTFSCPNHNNVGPRWYVWQGFDQAECLEAGTLVDFARAWALNRHGVHVPGTAIEPIEVRTWDRTYHATFTEQTVDAEGLGGTYLVQVEEESVTEMIGLADPSRT